MTPVGFEPTISAGERTKTYALHRAATGTGIKSTVYINYTITICFNNNVSFNNYYGRFQDLILLFKIPHGNANGFFEIYRQFGNAPSQHFARLLILLSTSVSTADLATL